MSEFINSYIIDILQEAKKNMNLAKREKINIEDVESAVNIKQDHIYKNRSTIQEMKLLADKVNLIELPNISESIKRPPNNINLLNNNFQIYSKELNKIIMENKIMLENTSLRADDINMLGNKRKVNFANESRNNLNIDNNGKTKNKRKISLNQAFKKTSQENAKKEGINIKENKKSKVNQIIDYFNEEEAEILKEYNMLKEIQEIIIFHFSCYYNCYYLLLEKSM